jgi:hypothetical protein
MNRGDRNYLFSVYTAERQDDQNALVVAFAIATAGITYVTLGVAYINEHCNGKGCNLNGHLSNLILVTAPAIPLALAAFLALNLAATRLRSVHLQRLEYALQTPLSHRGDSPTEPSFHTDAGLVYRPMDRRSDKPRVARMLFTVVTVMAYVPILAALLGFTWLALVHVSGTVPRYAAWTVYGLAELVEVMALLRSLGGTRFSYTGPEAGASAPHTKQYLVRALSAQRCVQIEDRGHHQKWRCPCQEQHLAILPKQKKLTTGVARSIARDLSCLPDGWLS